MKREPRPRKDTRRRLSGLPLLLALACLAACTSSRDNAEADRDAIVSMTISPSGVNLSLKDEREVTNVASRAARLAADGPSQGAPWRRAAPAEVPFLSQTVKGRDFLRIEGDRAIARGDPQDFCPVTETSENGATSARIAAASALSRCLASVRALPPLDQSGAATSGTPDPRAGCGCRLAAINDIVTLPRRDTGYATGAAARIKAGFLGIDGLFVAEDAGDGTIGLRDVEGVIGVIEPQGGDRASLTLRRPGSRTEGLRIAGVALPVGFRRGRLATRYYFDGGRGRRAVVLVGFDPAELAERAGAWLAFPQDADRLLAGAAEASPAPG